MGVLKGYCQYCGYFYGDEQSTFVRADQIDYDGKILGKCTKCGGVEFLSAERARKSAARRAGGNTAKGAWSIAKGVAKAGGAVVKGGYEVAKWGVEKVSEMGAGEANLYGEPLADTTLPSLPDGVFDVPDAPPSVPAGLWDSEEGSPDLPDGIFDGDIDPGTVAAVIDYKPDKAPFLTADAEEILAEEPTGSILKPTNEPTDEDFNAIDDAPLEDDYDAEPLPHEGPVEPTGSPDSTKWPQDSDPLPPKEQIVAEDTKWRQANKDATPAEMARHQKQYRERLFRRRAIDIRESGGRIQYGGTSYEELLPDGTIHAVEERIDGSGNSSYYEVWDRPDGTSKSGWRHEGSSIDPSGASSDSFVEQGTQEFDGEAYHIHNETHSARSVTTRESTPEGPHGTEGGND